MALTAAAATAAIKPFNLYLLTLNHCWHWRLWRQFWQLKVWKWRIWRMLRSFSLGWSANYSLFVRFQRISPVYSLQRHNNDTAADTRQPFAALSGISRHTRRTKVSIQRQLPCFPPAISAEVWQ